MRAAGVGVALAAAADGDVLDEVIARAGSRRGKSMVLLLGRAEAVAGSGGLEELADDPVMGQEVLGLLGRAH